MSVAALVTLGAACWLGLCAVAYLAYTPGGVLAFRPLLGLPRRVAVALGVLVLVVGSVAGGEPLEILFALVGAALAWLIHARHWLIPRKVRRALPVQRSGGFEGPVVVLPDETLVPVAVLQRERVLVVGDLLVVHCAVAGSVAAFRVLPGREIQAVLPHATGFEIGGGRHRWDGVDGRALDGGVALDRVAVDVLQRIPDTSAASVSLCLPDGLTELPPLRVIQPRVRGARGVADPMALGVVEDGAWCPVEQAAAQAGDRYVLARWAARCRGLSGGP